MDQNLKKILELRAEIDIIDEQLIKLLHERILLSLKLKEIKKEYKVSAHVPEREKQIIKRIDDFILDKENREIIKDIYKKILDESRGIQLSDNDE